MYSLLITELRPILIQRWSGTFSDVGYRAILDDSSALLRQESAAKQRTTIIVDMRQVSQISTEQRQLQTDWLRDNEALLREVCVGAAFVLKSPMIRVMLTTVLWMVPLPCPSTVTTQMSTAFDWCTEQLRKNGVAAPKDLRANPYARWLTDTADRRRKSEVPPSRIKAAI